MGYAISIPYTPPAATVADVGGTYNADGSYNPLVMDGTKNQASNAMADLTRAKYDDWKTRFFPKIDDLLNMTTYSNPELLTTEVAKSTDTINKSYDNVAGLQSRNVARYGMSQAPDQVAAQDSAMNLGKAAALVDAANNTRTMLKDRDREIAAGGVYTPAA
jgi:hypothetical protein